MIRGASALLCGVLLLLAGCASAHHPVVMQLPATQQVLSGAMSTGSGAQDLTLTSDDGRLACNGVSLLEYAMPGCKDSGAVRLQCTDGRNITAGWQMEDCTSGAGEGTDGAGNPVRLLIGRAAQTGGSALPVTQSVAVKPVVTVPATRDDGSYGFHLGAGYVAGFSATHGANAVFADAETGLVVTRRATLADAPVVLTDITLHTGQEAFVLLPTEGAAIRRIRVGMANGSRWLIEGGDRLPAGLPVMDIDGQLIALTVDDGLLATATLRRYLQLALPGFPDAPATNPGPAQLRARILPGMP